jgi:hypothetical protein
MLVFAAQARQEALVRERSLSRDFRALYVCVRALRSAWAFATCACQLQRQGHARQERPDPTPQHTPLIGRGVRFAVGSRSVECTGRLFAGATILPLHRLYLFCDNTSPAQRLQHADSTPTEALAYVLHHHLLSYERRFASGTCLIVSNPRHNSPTLHFSPMLLYYVHSYSSLSSTIYFGARQSACWAQQ